MDHTTQQQPDHVQWEIDLLGNIDPAIRLRSAMELGRLQAAGAASALVERLGLEREFFIRETLTWAVLRIADDAMPYLYQALSSTRWPARMQAVHVLGKLSRFEDADRLAPLVRDEVDAVASRGYWAAWRTHNPSVVPVLVGQLSRGDSEHRNSLTVTPLASWVPRAPTGRPCRWPRRWATRTAGPPRRAQRDRPAAAALR